MLNLRNLLMPLLLAFCVNAEEKKELYEPEFSTAGFFQVDETVRKASNFNVGWRFFKGKAINAQMVDFDDSKWSVVNTPNGLELVPLNASGGVNYQGEAWYRKHFNIEASQLKDKKNIIHFEAIMGKSKIFVNGKLVKEQFGGFLPIHIDVSKYLVAGKNIIAVWCDNSNDGLYPPGKPQEHLDFSYFGGIYRDVWFITHNPVYITNANATDIVAGGGVFVHYTDFSKESVKVNAKVNLQNELLLNTPITLSAALYRHKSNEKIVEESTVINLTANSNTTSNLNFVVKNPALWHPDAPNLHDLVITVKDQQGKVLDVQRQRIGIRKIEFRGKDGLYLNGEAFQDKLMGANRHQDFAIIGNALPNKTHWRDAKKLREASLRLIRNAHYPQDPAFMDACDELGLFVIVNTPGWQYWNNNPIFRKRVLSDIRNMVRRDRNHVSVIMWEPILNETHYPADFAKQVHDITHEEFPFPGCYTACDLGAQGQEHFDIIFSHPYAWRIFGQRVVDNAENRKQLLFDFSKDNRPVYTREWGDCVDNWNSHNSPSRADRSWGEAAQLVQAIHYSKPSYVYTSWDGLYDQPRQIFGGSLWHSFDHQRGYHPDPFWGGIMDAYRQPKYSYYMFKSQMDPNIKIPNVESGPFIFIAHEMTPFSGKDIVVFSNCDEVRLSLNGKLIGTKSTKTAKMPHVPVTFEDIYHFFDIKELHRSHKPNQAVILVEGLIDGKVVCKEERRPSLRRNKIILKPDYSGVGLTADGSDIIPIVAYLADNDGNIRRLTHEYVRFKVEGEGELITDSTIVNNPVRVNWGEAVALVRATTKAGKIKISAEVLKPGVHQTRSATLEIESKSTDKTLIYSELPRASENKVDPQLQQSIEDISEVYKELEKVKKELNEIKIREVEKQQSDFE